MGRGTNDGDTTWLVARVEWRSEGRWAERPVAVLLGGERVEVTVVDRWVDGPAIAGEEAHACFVVADEQGRTFRVRQSTGGRTTVELLPAMRAEAGIRYDDPQGES